jgi:hypothetical protein
MGLKQRKGTQFEPADLLKSFPGHGKKSALHPSIASLKIPPGMHPKNPGGKVNLPLKHNRSVTLILLSALGISTALSLNGCKSAPKETPTPPAVTTAPTPAPAPAAPVPVIPLAANLSLDQAVKATQPIAYYRFEGAKGVSEVGTTTYELTGGALLTSGGAGNVADQHFALLDGKDGWIQTTQMGGIEKTGSIMAWVNLGMLPKTTGRILYVAGESQSGNDFDLQFEGDNGLRFYTGAGGNVGFLPDPHTLVNQWHMIVATMDAVAPARAIYWDGQSAATDKSGSNTPKTARFTIGESPVFTGRFFPGGIDEVALWNRVLTPAEVSAIYQSATKKPAGGQ